MYNSSSLQEKWQPVLEHNDLPEIIKSIISCVNVALWNNKDIREQLRNCLHQIADDL